MMSRPKTPWLAWYYHLIMYVSKNRTLKRDLHFRDLHTVTASVLTTSILMWLYAFLALNTISSRVPGIVGVLASIVHLFSPMLFRVTNSSFLVSNVFIGAGLIHQATFSYYSGGFDSATLKWIAILPMLAGICSGLRGAITWSLITLAVALGFFILEFQGHVFPTAITDTGVLTAHAYIQFGWIFLNSVLIIVYALLWEKSEKIHRDQKKKIDDLFRVLFHDLANPLGRLSIGLSVVRRKEDHDPETERGLAMATQATDSMLEITKNVRSMYAVSVGKESILLLPTSLEESVDYVLSLYSAELERKKITTIQNLELIQNLRLLVEPIGFKNQVLSNIFSNAIKFSEERGKIQVSAYPWDEEFLMVEIKDDGVGIPLDVLPNLFDVSKKNSRSGTKGEPGMGFGLQIIKSFVELYGGELSIDSRDGRDGGPRGTTVKLKLRMINE